MSYSDVGSLTSYPQKIDARNSLNEDIKKNNVTVYNLLTDIVKNEHLEINTDFQDYVAAGDVNVLQDMTLAIERTLGINPQGNYKHVRERLETIETSIASAVGSINGHTHSGISGSPSKINLNSEVFNLLPKTNINLNSSVTGGLTAADIKTQPGSNISTYDYINSFVPRTAGSAYPITGPLYIKANNYSRVTGEWDVSTLFPGYPNLVDDSNAFTGKAYRISYGNNIRINSGSHELRHGMYSVAVRVKKASDANVNFIVKIGISSVLVQKSFTNEDFVNGQGAFNVFYVPYNHNPVYNNNTYFIEIHNSGNPSKQGDILVDSVVIVPLHNAVIDMGTVI